MTGRKLVGLLKEARRSILLAFAGLWRRLMFRTTVIAISGSVGKSTARQMILSTLPAGRRTLSNRGKSNHFHGVIMTLAAMRPWHQYVVLEIGLNGPGQMERMARAVRPDIAILVSVAKTHTMKFRSLDVTAHEKTRLIEAVKPGGLAILNDDNPYLTAYPPPSSIRTVYYGSTHRSTVSATNVTSRWPERLSFTAQVASKELPIGTRLIGRHWVGSVLPALALADAIGLDLAEAAAAISSCPPVERRLSATELPNGATILRDEFNGSADTMRAALEVFADATAKRKMLVLTDVSDSSKKPRTRLRDYGREAARVAHSAMFIGDHCEQGAEAAMAAGLPADQVWSFYSLEDAALKLRAETRAGDLILIRGRQVDHLERLFLALTGDVMCWRNTCPKRIQCTRCSELTKIRVGRLVPKTFQ